MYTIINGSLNPSKSQTRNMNRSNMRKYWTSTKGGKNRVSREESPRGTQRGPQTRNEEEDGPETAGAPQTLSPKPFYRLFPGAGGIGGGSPDPASRSRDAGKTDGVVHSNGGNIEIGRDGPTRPPLQNNRVSRRIYPNSPPLYAPGFFKISKKKQTEFPGKTKLQKEVASGKGEENFSDHSRRHAPPPWWGWGHFSSPPPHASMARRAFSLFKGGPS